MSLSVLFESEGLRGKFKFPNARGGVDPTHASNGRICTVVNRGRHKSLPGLVGAGGC